MKNLKNLGEILNKNEQQSINGGGKNNGCISHNSCYQASDCLSFVGGCTSFSCVSPKPFTPGVCVAY